MLPTRKPRLSRALPKPSLRVPLIVVPLAAAKANPGCWDWWGTGTALLSWDTAELSVCVPSGPEGHGHRAGPGAVRGQP